MPTYTGNKLSDDEIADLPQFLQEVVESVRNFSTKRISCKSVPSTFSTISEQNCSLAHSTCIEDNGARLYSGKLSPGCQICHQGHWECVFITMECNLACEFCLRPYHQDDAIRHSSWVRTPGEFTEFIVDCGVRGVSFSGGEPLLSFAELMKWLDASSLARPRPYLWLYTNGLLLTAKICKQLRDAGLDEIRFNLAATGYQNPHVLRKIEIAAEWFSALTVEIPVIPEDLPIIIEMLERWITAGVRFLNLHELIYEKNTDSWSMEGKRIPAVMSDGHQCFRNPDSLPAILEIIKTADSMNLPLSINACTVYGKDLQIQGRRRLYAKCSLKPYEKLKADGSAECFCAFTNEQSDFFAPQDLPFAQQHFLGRRFARIVRLLPLAQDQADTWIDFELM